ncbi:MAG: fructose-bisphosphate aldolase [Nanoarchaeota archaeon]|nr:fructose-bisphosphate aldolase [Nanoarchaeota archaeon]
MKLTTKGKSLLLAYDQGLEHGPTDFQDKNIDPNYILDIAKKGKYNGIILQKGIAEKYYNKQAPLILKLNGKTNIYKGEPISLQICSVKEAINLGAKAVGYTIYLGSKYESKMLKEFGKIEEEAHDHKIPVITWMYPRGESVKKITPSLIAYSARVGLEIGSDFVKVHYTGSSNTFQKVVQAAGKCKVLCAGGHKATNQGILTETKNVMQAGATGMAIGRNIWQHKQPLKLTKALKKIIFENKTVKQAMKELK